MSKSLREAREAAGLTQEQLGDRLDLKAGQVSRIEREVRHLPARCRDAAERILGPHGYVLPPLTRRQRVLLAGGSEFSPEAKHPVSVSISDEQLSKLGRQPGTSRGGFLRALVLHLLEKGWTSRDLAWLTDPETTREALALQKNMQAARKHRAP
jgi:hypothetical protein